MTNNRLPACYYSSYVLSSKHEEIYSSTVHDQNTLTMRKCIDSINFPHLFPSMCQKFVAVVKQTTDNNANYMLLQWNTFLKENTVCNET